jgi:alcohol dehydrogenase
MNVKKAYYITYQNAVNLGARCLNWRRPIVSEGPGSLSAVPGLLRQEGVGRVLIVTGPSIGRTLAPLLTEQLDGAGLRYQIFDQVEANPSVTTVEAICKLYQSSGCQGFIALGGGSPMDAAKGAAARVARPDKSLARMAGLFGVGRQIPPFIAIPTTAGTGSETTIAAVITDKETHHKFTLMDLHLVPKYAVLDSRLTVGLPQHVTATTGMDALTHAVEAYVCRTYNTRESLADAEDAVRLIFRNLENACRDGSDLEARSAMMTAAYKAGFAFTRAGVGNVHAIAHTLGGLYNTPHGLANAVILPIVLEDYGAVVYRKLARLAVIAGVAGEGSDECKAKAFIAEIRAMNARMGIPDHFDFILTQDIPQMVAWALAEANPVYPVPVIYDEVRCAAVIKRIRYGC